MPLWITLISYGTKLVLLILLCLSVWSIAIIVERSKSFKEIFKQEADFFHAKKLRVIAFSSGQIVMIYWNLEPF